MSAEERFWAKVQKAEECWLWTASLDGSGYGQFWVGDKMFRSHRVAYEFTVGKIPEGQCVLHRCDNPKCCNPRHLFLGTMRDNTRDMLSKGRNGCGRLPGEANRFSKLTEANVRAIRARRAAGEKLKVIAVDFGITEANVSYIAKRKGWKHVT